MNIQRVPTYSAPAIDLGKREGMASHLAWYVVPLAVLLSISIFIAAAVEVWCVTHGQSLVVSWHLNSGGGSVTIACK